MASSQSLEDCQRAGATEYHITPPFFFLVYRTPEVSRSRGMSAFTPRGTCRLLPVSTAINKPTVAEYKYNPSHFLSDG
jgi:hypothetical protein